MFATILLPNFYLQAVTRHQPALNQGPLAVLDASKNKPVLWQLNAAAAEAGVQTGMTPSQALARCLALVIKARAREAEEQISHILWHHAFMLSPFVEATAPGVCTMELKQSHQLTAKLETAVALLQKCHVIARAGAAANPDTSFLAAHLAAPVLQIGEVADFLAPLPIETLRI